MLHAGPRSMLGGLTRSGATGWRGGTAARQRPGGRRAQLRAGRGCDFFRSRRIRSDASTLDPASLVPVEPAVLLFAATRLRRAARVVARRRSGRSTPAMSSGCRTSRCAGRGAAAGPGDIGRRPLRGEVDVRRCAVDAGSATRQSASPRSTGPAGRGGPTASGTCPTARPSRWRWRARTTSTCSSTWTTRRSRRAGGPAARLRCAARPTSCATSPDEVAADLIALGLSGRVPQTAASAVRRTTRPQAPSRTTTADAMPASWESERWTGRRRGRRRGQRRCRAARGGGGRSPRRRPRRRARPCRPGRRAPWRRPPWRRSGRRGRPGRGWPRRGEEPFAQPRRPRQGGLEPVDLDDVDADADDGHRVPATRP